MATTLPDCMMPDGGDPCAGFVVTYEHLQAVKADLARLRAEMALASGLLAAHQWQPIASAPLDFTPILVFVRGSRLGSLQEEADTMHIAFWKRDSWHLQDDDISIVEPAYWQPLPEPPK